MKPDSRFNTLVKSTKDVNFTLFGEVVTAPKGSTLAAAILSHSGDAFRQTETGALRSAFCMMGVCFECLVEVNGNPNTQSCMILVEEKMLVKRQVGLRQIGICEND
jgi:predicted molibdopterin-dependent oxidoreductase YjgC